MAKKQDPKGKKDPKKDAKSGKKKEKLVLPGQRGGKAKKKKWSKVKVKDKLNNATTVDEKLRDRIFKDLPKTLLVTISTISDKYKVSGAIARKAIADLLVNNQIKQVGDHHYACPIYTGSQAKKEN